MLNWLAAGMGKGLVLGLNLLLPHPQAPRAQQAEWSGPGGVNHTPSPAALQPQVAFTLLPAQARAWCECQAVGTRSTPQPSPAPLTWSCRRPWAHPPPTPVPLREPGSSGMLSGSRQGCSGSSDTPSRHQGQCPGESQQLPPPQRRESPGGVVLPRVCAASHRPAQQCKGCASLKSALWLCLFFWRRRVHVPRPPPAAMQQSLFSFPSKAASRALCATSAPLSRAPAPGTKQAA